jgi:hypothetical protein
MASALEGLRVVDFSRVLAAADQAGSVALTQEQHRGSMPLTTAVHGQQTDEPTGSTCSSRCASGS